MKRYATIVSMAVFITLVSSAGAFATTTTDLLEAPIPTVMDYGEWEYGVRARISEDIAKGRFFTNSIHGSPFRNLEVGATWNLNRPIGPFAWGAKYQILDNQRDNDFISLAVGIDNITGITGEGETDPQPYVVASRDFGSLTAYVGYIHFDGNDNNIYGGLNWRWNDRWQIRGEYVGTQENEEAIISGGIRYKWIKHVDLGAWVSNDSFTDDTIITLEFALRGDLRDLTLDADSITY